LAKESISARCETPKSIDTDVIRMQLCYQDFQSAYVRYFAVVDFVWAKDFWGI